MPQAAETLVAEVALGVLVGTTSATAFLFWLRSASRAHLASISTPRPGRRRLPLSSSVPRIGFTAVLLTLTLALGKVAFVVTILTFVLARTIVLHREVSRAD